jgi:hypothetical protein
MVYELIDAFAKRNFNKSIYGQYLTKIVKSVKNPNGGLMPELAGSTMRYLIIGEIAGKDCEQLKEAKKLYRSGNSVYDVFLQTGWYFNKFDLKWRKRISDDGFQFDAKILHDNNESYFLPESYSYDRLKRDSKDLADNKKSMAELIADGYNGRIGEYINFEEAYKNYPELKNIYSFFSANVLKDATYAFYFSPDIPNSLVLIKGQQLGKYDLEKLKYVALHEMQHYIQRVEDFGTGGNENLAALLDAAGGQSVKSFYNSLSAFQKRFAEIGSLIPVADYQKLCEDLHILSPVHDKNTNFDIRRQNALVKASKYYDAIVDRLKTLTSNQLIISGSNSSISYFLLTLYSFSQAKPIEEFITKHIGAEYIELFKHSLEQNKKVIEKDQHLIKKGWTAQDLYILNFQLYESLIGEIESRYTQQTTKIPKELVDYFDYYTSETVDTDKVSVLNNSVLFDGGNAIASLETTTDGKYIIHIPTEIYSNSLNILHETGHILYDLAQEQIAMIGTVNEEDFCHEFVHYVYKKNIDPMLTSDLEELLQDDEFTSTGEFDFIFDTILFSKSEIDESGLLKRLDFVMKILE